MPEELFALFDEIIFARNREVVLGDQVDNALRNAKSAHHNTLVSDLPYEICMTVNREGKRVSNFLQPYDNIDGTSGLRISLQQSQ